MSESGHFYSSSKLSICWCNWPKVQLSRLQYWPCHICESHCPLEHSSVCCESCSALPWTWTGKSSPLGSAGPHTASMFRFLLPAASLWGHLPGGLHPSLAPHTCSRFCSPPHIPAQLAFISTQDCPPSFRLPKTLSFLPFMHLVRSSFSEQRGILSSALFCLNTYIKLTVR